MTCPLVNPAFGYSTLSRFDNSSSRSPTVKEVVAAIIRGGGDSRLAAREPTWTVAGDESNRRYERGRRSAGCARRFADVASGCGDQSIPVVPLPRFAAEVANKSLHVS